MLFEEKGVLFRCFQFYVCALISGFWVSAMSGCAVGPNFEKPQADVPAAWSDANSTSAVTEELTQWWTTFGDPNLTSLVERAINSNLNLKLAESRIRQARAARGVVASGFWPSADLSASYSRGRASGSSPITELYQTGLDAIWEIDIFGGTRRSIEAANADLLTAIEDHRDVLITLTAEVALNYIDLRGLQQEIVIALNNLKAQQHSANLTRERFEGGFVSALDVANANALVASTASQIPVLRGAAQQTIYNIAILLGLEPSALLKELLPSSTIPVGPVEVPAGVPSDLLRRRPDIRRAEAQLHAETALVGVAVADLFPRFTLSGSYGYRDNQFDSLTEWRNRSWSFGPSASWQIFSAGRVRSNIELQKAVQEQSMIAYQQTVLTALQEVENALIASSTEFEHRSALIEVVAANRKAVELSTQLYIEGQADFLNVLVAQRALYSSEDALVQSNRNVSTNLVALYKALGGGWDISLEQTSD
jgi:multidrug efflux system outer membrane protein